MGHVNAILLAYGADSVTDLRLAFVPSESYTTLVRSKFVLRATSVGLCLLLYESVLKIGPKQQPPMMVQLYRKISDVAASLQMLLASAKLLKCLLR